MHGRKNREESDFEQIGPREILLRHPFSALSLVETSKFCVFIGSFQASLLFRTHVFSFLFVSHQKHNESSKRVRSRKSCATRLKSIKSETKKTKTICVTSVRHHCRPHAASSLVRLPAEVAGESHDEEHRHSHRRLGVRPLCPEDWHRPLWRGWFPSLAPAGESFFFSPLFPFYLFGADTFFSFLVANSSPPQFWFATSRARAHDAPGGCARRV